MCLFGEGTRDVFVFALLLYFSLHSSSPSSKNCVGFLHFVVSPADYSLGLEAFTFHPLLLFPPKAEHVAWFYYGGGGEQGQPCGEQPEKRRRTAKIREEMAVWYLETVGESGLPLLLSSREVKPLQPQPESTSSCMISRELSAGCPGLVRLPVPVCDTEPHHWTSGGHVQPGQLASQQEP